MSKQSDYNKRKEDARRRQADMSRKGREIGPMPPIIDPHRRAKAVPSLKYFCEIYLRPAFYLAWSRDHLRAIDRLEQIIRHGGLYALAMARGSGKTTLMEAATLWAVLNGYRKFATLVAATKPKAIVNLDTIRTWIENRPELGEDYPEVCYPIRCLEGITNRQAGQLYNGEQTLISWTMNLLVLPTIPESLASGSVIGTAGITGAELRGQKHPQPNGAILRPSLALIDDAQTRKSAYSDTQSKTRFDLISGDVLGMAGPDVRMAGMITCTVIRNGDLSDRILDRKENPDWNGERTGMVIQWPSNEKLWETYAELRREGLRAGDDGLAARDFYREHRLAMDAGAEVSWPERFAPPALSAIQEAVDLRLRDAGMFASEYQNQPEDEHADTELLTADQIAEKVNNIPRGHIPTSAQHITGFIDVQKKCLYWMLVAWEPNFTGYVIDYGTFPSQRSRNYSMRTMQRTLGRAYPGAGLEGTIYAGLRDLLAELLTKRDYERDDGAMMKPSMILVDAAYQTDTIHQVIRAAATASVMPSHGTYIGAASMPMVLRTRKKGQLRGLGYSIPPPVSKRELRYVLIDTNLWKSAVHARLSTPIGDKGALTLYGKTATEHRLLAEHLTTEYRVVTSGQGRTVDEWKETPAKPDNHFFDCLVGAAVAAAMSGAVLHTDAIPKKRKPKRTKRSRTKYF